MSVAPPSTVALTLLKIVLVGGCSWHREQTTPQEPILCSSWPFSNAFTQVVQLGRQVALLLASSAEIEVRGRQAAARGEREAAALQARVVDSEQKVHDAEVHDAERSS